MLAPPVPTLQVIDNEQTVLRYDPAYTDMTRAPAEFREAYTELGTQLELASRTVSLRPDELLLIDNDVVVHGRVPFKARYDGTDRWLKRANIRLSGRKRGPQEEAEDGYGQRIVVPFS